MKIDQVVPMYAGEALDVVEAKPIKNVYLETLTLVERLHRRLLDVVKDEFDRRGQNDINAVQAILIYNLGDSVLTAGELRTRGYYLGSNVSYNLKKLVDLGFVNQEKSATDKRSTRVSLTQKGREVAAIMDGLYERHTLSLEPVAGLDADGFEAMNADMRKLERFWTDQILYRL